MQELREAAKKYGIKFGFYYSHAFDWEHPDAPGNDWDYDNPGGDKRLGGANWWLGDRKDFLPKAEKYVAEKSIPQIKELIAKYDPDILWFDTPSKLPLYLNIRIMEAINEADPEGKIVMNGRLVRFGSDQNMGDYKNTGDRAAFFPRTEGAWESIPTTNESYGYSVVDTLRKQASFFVQLLASAASKGGNILMNIGPMGNGKMDERDIRLLQQIGVWMNVNGESIYGTERTNLPIQPWGVTTCKGDTVMALPSGKTSKVKSIVTYDGELECAYPPLCVTLTLEDEIDISRGEMLVHPDNLPISDRNFEAMLVWMDEEEMDVNKSFYIKETTHTPRARVDSIRYKVDVNTMEHSSVDKLQRRNCTCGLQQRQCICIGARQKARH